MYRLVSSIWEYGKLIGYWVKDTISGLDYKFDLSEIKVKVDSGQIEDVELTRNYTLHGINGFDLRKLPHERSIKKSYRYDKLAIWTGNRLKEYCENALSGKRPRFAVSTIMNYINNPTESKVCILYGLRRTGKTVMMLHAIQKINLYSKCVYITLNENNSVYELFEFLSSLVTKGQRFYVFIDEITAVDGFIQRSATLADSYAGWGMHIVLAGTDSLLLNLAVCDNLFDRYCGVDTTYISYKEYYSIIKDTSVEVFLTDGGVLPRGVDYSHYLDTAVISNIVNTILKVRYSRKLQCLIELDSRGILLKAVNYVIMNLTFSGFSADFTDRDLYSARQLINMYRDGSDSFFAEVNDLLRYSLGIYDFSEGESIVEASYEDALRDLFITLDLVYPYTKYINGVKKKSYLITQPFIRFYQARVLVDILFESDWSKSVKRAELLLLKEKVFQDVKGLLLEDIILLNELKSGRQAHQYFSGNKEIDMLIIDDKNNVHLYEIKHSSKIVPNQCRYLNDKSFVSCIEEDLGMSVVSRNVLYMGKSKVVNGINYQNIEEFLLR